jgi:hypothetical protein
MEYPPPIFLLLVHSTLAYDSVCGKLNIVMKKIAEIIHL